VAALSTTALPAGTDAVTAVYSGDSNFNSTVTPAAVTVTVSALTPNISFATPSPTSLTLNPGESGIVTLSLTGNATFSGTVAFTCTGAPSESSCTVNPASLALVAGQTSNVSVVVTTTAPNDYSEAANHTPKWGGVAGGVSVAGLLIVVLPKRRRRIFAALLLVLIGIFATTALTGCSQSNRHYNYAGTPAGTTTLTVTATSGTVSQSTTFSLIVANI
jgi:hypothetical protein